MYIEDNKHINMNDFVFIICTASNENRSVNIIPIATKLNLPNPILLPYINPDFIYIAISAVLVKLKNRENMINIVSSKYFVSLSIFILVKTKNINVIIITNDS